jgi:hypothetical protein
MFVSFLSSSVPRQPVPSEGERRKHKKLTPEWELSRCLMLLRWILSISFCNDRSTRCDVDLYGLPVEQK